MMQIIVPETTPSTKALDLLAALNKVGIPATYTGPSQLFSPRLHRLELHGIAANASYDLDLSNDLEDIVAVVQQLYVGAAWKNSSCQDIAKTTISYQGIVL